MDHMINISIAGLKVDQEFPGIYEWHRVDTSANPDAASLAFSNWTPSENLHFYILLFCDNGEGGRVGGDLPTAYFIVKLRRGSGKDRQGMAVKVKGLKA